MLFTLLTAVFGVTSQTVVKAQDTKPNIVIIMSDDHDRHSNSADHMPILQSQIAAKGVEFTNHYTNTALCCPSRSTFLRGQATHNTNMTSVTAPGGNYNKWLVSGQDTNYLPHWLNSAGYRTEYLGKLMNGYGLGNYDQAPKGWDHADILVEPYIDWSNIPVFSTNGNRPDYFEGWHQTDVLRIKSLDRLDQIADQDTPFFMMIAPFAPHVSDQSSRPIPCTRHDGMFSDMQAPRTPNFNPETSIQQQKGGWIGGIERMNESAIDFADWTYRSRLQAIQSIDDIIEDVLAKLEEKGKLDNTYVIYTTDNGYHVGTHRLPAGKSTYFREDVNLPFYVRGPGVPQGVSSNVPGLHLDLAPTFLDIAGVAEADWPVFLDGRSLLPQWQDPEVGNGEGGGQANGKESINIEYWGRAGIEAPSGGVLGSPFDTTTYKTVRTLGASQSWLYTVWCSGENELYNTTADPYELNNLLYGDDVQPIHQRIANRLDTLLMVTKSCGQDSCRDPWSLIETDDGTTFTTLTEAMDEAYDDFFADFQKVQFGSCMIIQDDSNEAPYYPPLPDSGGLGREYRNSTDSIPNNSGAKTINQPNRFGTEAQRTGTIEELRADKRQLTDSEVGSLRTRDDTQEGY